jgi:hypothetical protein
MPRELAHHVADSRPAVIVDNKGGATGSIERARRRQLTKPDGYTLFPA